MISFRTIDQRKKSLKLKKQMNDEQIIVDMFFNVLKSIGRGLTGKGKRKSKQAKQKITQADLALLMNEISEKPIKNSKVPTKLLICGSLAAAGFFIARSTIKKIS